jgi:hypothetical protein
MARFEHDLRVQLREHRNRLYKSDWTIWPNQAGMMLRWMEAEPYIAALLSEIEDAPIDPAAWRQAGHGSHGIQYPDDETHRAKVCLDLLRERNYQVARSNATDFSSMAREFVELVVDPLVYYLEDRIDDGNTILGILERYKRRTEWFHQGDLYERYQVDKTRGETTLDAHLREYLVDQGVTFPFSQPRSPSGEADVVSMGDEPLALEIKLFLPDDGKGKPHLRQGFVQAARYAQDYGLPAGYLVVFNLTEQALVLPSDREDRWPASLTIGDRTIYCVVIDANSNRPSASKDRQGRHELSRTDLLGDSQSLSA